MVFTDTHTHLYAAEFDADRDAIIQKAIAEGIERLFLPNIDSSSIDAMLKLTELYPKNCFAMMGLHPCSVNENYEVELKQIEKYLFANIIEYSQMDKKLILVTHLHKTLVKNPYNIIFYIFIYKNN